MTDTAATGNGAGARAGRWRAATAVIASAALIGFAFGAIIPLISILLERAGVSPLVNGLNAAMSVVAILIVAPFVPRIAKAIGTLPALYLGVGLVAVPIALFSVSDSLALWFALRFAAGLGVALHWVISETWINLIASEKSRSRLIAFYVTVLAGGFALGPAVVGAVGTDGPWPFLLIAAATVVGGLPFLLVRGAAPPLDDSDAIGGQIALLRRTPVVFAAAFLAGIADNASWVVLPIYGLRTGSDAAEALLMVTAFVAGSIVVQAPLGILADRFGRVRLLWIGGALGALGALALPPLTGHVLMWPLLFLWGGVALGLYTLSLSLVGERFGPRDLASANAVFIFCYNAGNLIGPVAAGGAVGAVGPAGFAWVLAAVYAAVFCLGALDSALVHASRRKDRS